MSSRDRRTRRHLRSVQGLALTVAVLAAAACQGGGEDSSAEQVTPTFSTGDVSVDDTRQPPAPPIEGAVEGGVVSVVTITGPEFRTLPVFDPTASYYVDSASILSGLVTRSLTQWVYDPQRKAMVLIPDIATDLGKPNDDYTEWTYTIRPGVRFEDGTEVTAGDVAFGIMRSFDRGAFPYGASWSNEYFLDGDTYRGPYRSGTDYDGVTVDGDTLTIRMAKPFPDMPYWGAFPAMGPIPEAASNPNTYRMHPLATGPYKFAEYEPARSLTLVRNPEWDPETDPGRHQYPDEYHFRFGVVDATSTFDDIVSGDGRGSTTIDYDSVPADVLPKASEIPDQVAEGPTPCLFYGSPDYQKIKSIEIRRAIGYAWPYVEILTSHQSVEGSTAQAWSSLLAPSSPGRQTYEPLSTPPGEPDPEKARELLREADYDPDTLPLRWPYLTTDPGTVEYTKALRNAFEEVGFRTDPIRFETQAAYNAAKEDPTSPINLRLGGWCTDWPTGNASLLAQLTSVGTDSTRAFSYFDEPDVNAEANRIQTLPLGEQQAAWGELDREIQTEYFPIHVGFVGTAAMMHGSRIGGMNDDAVFGMPTWKDIHVRQ